jgi:hypothetical protein
VLGVEENAGDVVRVAAHGIHFPGLFVCVYICVYVCVYECEWWAKGLEIAVKATLK